MVAELLQVGVEVDPRRGERLGRAVDLAVDHHGLDRRAARRARRRSPAELATVDGCRTATGSGGRAPRDAPAGPSPRSAAASRLATRRASGPPGRRAPPGRPASSSRRSAALVHAGAGQLGQLAVGLLDGGGRRRPLLEDPLEILLRGPLLGTPRVEGVTGGLDRREVLGQGRRGARSPTSAPSRRVRTRPVRCSSWWRAVSQSCIVRATTASRRDRTASRSPARSWAKPSAASHRSSDRSSGDGRVRPDRAQVTRQELGQPGAIRRVGQGDGQSPVQAAGSGVVGRLVGHVVGPAASTPRHPSRRGWRALLMGHIDRGTTGP